MRVDKIYILSSSEQGLLTKWDSGMIDACVVLTVVPKTPVGT